MKKLIKCFVEDERGLETVEYAIIVGLIVASLIVLLAAIGAWVNMAYNNLKTGISA